MTEQPPPDDDREGRALRLVQSVLMRPEVERKAFLEQQVGDDWALQKSVMAMLADCDQTQSFLAASPLERISLSQMPGGEVAGTWSAFLHRIGQNRTVWERYLDEGEIARGGMGAIHQVRDEDLRRTLAMKLMLTKGEVADSSRTDASLGRFLEEAQITSQLDHPGIVPVHEIGVDEQARVYFTMKLVKGEDLRSIFDRVRNPADTEWNTTRALSTLLRVCEAMAFAHTKGVIHRDLKPANVMVGAFGETYVMDWGIAKIVDQKDTKDLRVKPTEVPTLVKSERKEVSANTPLSPLVTMDGDVIGTPAFMSPEQACGRIDEMGPHSDVYAVGAMLYQLLTGQMPYVRPGDHIPLHALLANVQQGPPPPIHQLNPAVSTELIAICDKAMARSITQRFSDMTELADDLRAYLDRRVVAAYESGAIAELKKWVMRNKALATTAAAALVAVLALSGWALVERANALTEKERADQNATRATARKTEFDQLAGVVLLEEALASELDLYPAWTEKIPALEKWLADDAQKLADLKPALEQTLINLQARALPPTADELHLARASHPSYIEWALLEQKTELLRRSQAVREGREQFVAAALPTELLQVDALKLNTYAWRRVRPDWFERTIGEEREALAAMRAAESKIAAGDDSLPKGMMFNTLAWALLANGLDEEARQAGRAAVEAATPAKKEFYRGSTNNLEETVAATLGEGGPKSLSVMDSKVARLKEEISRLRTWQFESESQRFLHSTLSDLSTKISSFETNQKHQVEMRLKWARQIKDLTLNHPHALSTWAEAQESVLAADGVLASELYREHPVDLKIQPGLVPIGMNPVSQLWEFYHLRSAVDAAAGLDAAEISIPEHHEDGSINIEDGTGIVFVLIPGGSFLMGSQGDDPDQPNYDVRTKSDETPVHEVTLDAFLLSRYEMTVGQWSRLTGGGEPSWYQHGAAFERDDIPFGWTHPVNQVSWDDCRLELRHHGLRLPTEAQWEYGTRAGTTTMWWTGQKASSLEGAANVLDIRAMTEHTNWGNQLGNFDDGHIGMAPVGRFRPNAFGLFDTHGNVWEWCRDGFGSYRISVREGDGMRDVPVQKALALAFRGGSFSYHAGEARSANRYAGQTSMKDANLGVRPIYDLRR